MKLRRILAVAALAACTHGEPFGVGKAANDQPLAPGAPLRLTYNLVVDSEASWLPDGSGIVYSALRPDFADTTFCIQQLPPGGGQATRAWCPVAAAPPDSARAYQAPSVSPSGRLLYLRSARAQPHTGWSARALVLERLDGSAPPRVILASPFDQYTGLSQIQWLDGDRFVFRADLYYIGSCRGCRPFEGDSGRFVVVGDLRSDPPVFARLPGTDTATSVAVADSGLILYTLQGDTRVFARRLSTGGVSTLWDFAPLIPLEVRIAGTRLVAVTTNGIHVVDLLAASDSVITAAAYNGIALSPDGKRLVAQRVGDLWEFLLP